MYLVYVSSHAAKHRQSYDSFSFFSAGAVYNQLYSKLSTNQKQSYICKSAIYAHWNGLSKLSTNRKQSYICKSAVVLRRRDTKESTVFDKMLLVADNGKSAIYAHWNWL